MGGETRSGLRFLSETVGEVGGGDDMEEEVVEEDGGVR